MVTYPMKTRLLFERHILYIYISRTSLANLEQIKKIANLIAQKEGPSRNFVRSWDYSMYFDTFFVFLLYLAYTNM